MKERLDQLTLQQLIELSCGDYTVLAEGDELPMESDLLPRAASILGEYKSIALPAQAKMDLMKGEKFSKLRMKEKCARICIMLCESGRADMAREVLVLLNVSPGHMETDSAVLAQCQAILGEVKYEADRLEKQDGAKSAPSPEQTRREWLSEVASVMGVFRMNIDPAHTNAAIYANLVRQAVERTKAMSKMPPMARMFM